MNPLLYRALVWLGMLVYCALAWRAIWWVFAR